MARQTRPFRRCICEHSSPRFELMSLPSQHHVGSGDILSPQPPGALLGMPVIYQHVKIIAARRFVHSNLSLITEDQYE
jgi:hypothetical protein